MKWIGSILLILLLSIATCSTAAAYPYGTGDATVQSGLDYIRSCQHDDGGFAEAEKLRRQYIAEGKACEYSCFDNAAAACEYARSAGAGELIIIKNGRAEVTEL